jgi:hypothetical protein
MYKEAGKVLGDEELKYCDEPSWLCGYRGDADEFVNCEVLWVSFLPRAEMVLEVISNSSLYCIRGRAILGMCYLLIIFSLLSIDISSVIFVVTYLKEIYRWCLLLD